MYNDYSIRLESVKGFFVVEWLLRVKSLFEENSGESLFAGNGVKSGTSGPVRRVPLEIDALSLDFLEEIDNFHVEGDKKPLPVGNV